MVTLSVYGEGWGEVRTVGAHPSASSGQALCVRPCRVRRLGPYEGEGRHAELPTGGYDPLKSPFLRGTMLGPRSPYGSGLQGILPAALFDKFQALV